jgi:hypothetical protein
MKACTTSLANFLAAQQAATDSNFAVAECFTIGLASGLTLYYTNADVPILYNGNTFLANGPIIEGLKYKATTGLDEDRQEITISVNYATLGSLPTVSGAPFMQALASGAFALATIQRDRVFFSDRVGGMLVGGLTLFKGRFVEVKPGRLSAKVTVANSLIVLQQSMPRRTFAPTCQHVFGDSGCTANPTGYTYYTGMTAAAGSTASVAISPLAMDGMVGGTLAYTSGVNFGVYRTVTAVVPLSSITTVAFPSAPGTGDAFYVFRANSVAGTAGAGSTQQNILTSQSLLLHGGGILTWTSGANAGIGGTVRFAQAGVGVWMAYPFPNPVNAGDAFVLSFGCDHTEAMCVNTYNNVANFLGFPQIPPPQTAFPL